LSLAAEQPNVEATLLNAAFELFEADVSQGKADKAPLS
jgi:hypothetical protein